jgi:hypothetical protein
VSDLLEEIKEDVKNEQFMYFLHHYGKRFLISLLVAVSVFALYVWWQRHQLEQQQAWGDAFYNAQMLKEDGQMKEAHVAWERLATQAKPPFSSLAQMMLAEEHLARKEYTQALALFDAVYAAQPEQFLGYLAGLYAVNMVMEHALQPEWPLEERFATLISEANPWRLSLLEMASLQAYKQQQFDKALPLITELMQGLPEYSVLKQRAGILQQAIQHAQYADKAKK